MSASAEISHTAVPLICFPSIYPSKSGAKAKKEIVMLGQDNMNKCQENLSPPLSLSLFFLIVEVKKKYSHEIMFRLRNFFHVPPSTTICNCNEKGNLRYNNTRVER